MKTLTKVGTALAVTAAVSAPALAQSTGTIADLGTAADFSDVKSVMITIAIAVMGVLVLWYGIRKVKRSVS